MLYPRSTCSQSAWTYSFRGPWYARAVRRLYPLVKPQPLHANACPAFMFQGAATLSTMTRMGDSEVRLSLQKRGTCIDSSDQMFYMCSECRTPVASSINVISKRFHGFYGAAYLFDQVQNITSGEERTSQMTTGEHGIKTQYCSGSAFESNRVPAPLTAEIGI